MIDEYNRKELLLALLKAFGSLVCYAIAFAFFYWAFLLSAALTRPSQLIHWAPWFGAAVLLVITFSGYRTWRNRGGYYGYEQSGMYHRTSAGRIATVYLAGVNAHQVTGPAYLLGQLFLSGPLLALRALSHLHNRIPKEPDLEGRLQAVLERLESANKWQGEEDYPDDLREILLLARMRKIDFSAAKGTARFRALKKAAVDVE